ncbi:hypothetical protein [[Acholeplasma] multilocale]|uniref:hypothetical protein n=1 Tax=[Acholeplasma] multilocale TaxID=264638 RepID=UPI00047BAA1C|nr:hypothetical protein [[Acholeplasma] multilocale]
MTKIQLLLSEWKKVVAELTQQIQEAKKQAGMEDGEDAMASILNRTIDSLTEEVNENEVIFKDMSIEEFSEEFLGFVADDLAEVIRVNYNFDEFNDETMKFEKENGDQEIYKVNDNLKMAFNFIYVQLNTFMTALVNTTNDEKIYNVNQVIEKITKMVADKRQEIGEDEFLKTGYHYLEIVLSVVVKTSDDLQTSLTGILFYISMSALRVLTYELSSEEGINLGTLNAIYNVFLSTPMILKSIKKQIENIL